MTARHFSWLACVCMLAAMLCLVPGRAQAQTTARDSVSPAPSFNLLVETDRCKDEALILNPTLRESATRLQPGTEVLVRDLIGRVRPVAITTPRGVWGACEALISEQISVVQQRYAEEVTTAQAPTTEAAHVAPQKAKNWLLPLLLFLALLTVVLVWAALRERQHRKHKDTFFEFTPEEKMKPHTIAAFFERLRARKPRKRLLAENAELMEELKATQQEAHALQEELAREREQATRALRRVLRRRQLIRTFRARMRARDEGIKELEARLVRVTQEAAADRTRLTEGFAAILKEALAASDHVKIRLLLHPAAVPDAATTTQRTVRFRVVELNGSLVAVLPTGEAFLYDPKTLVKRLLSPRHLDYLREHKVRIDLAAALRFGGDAGGRTSAQRLAHLFDASTPPPEEAWLREKIKAERTAAQGARKGAVDYLTRVR